MGALLTIIPFLQIQATKALRDGLELYDRRRGWRGVLTNKANIENWFEEKDIKKLKEKKNDRDSIEMFLNMFSYLSILAFTGFIIKSFFPEYSDVYSLLFFIGMFPGIFVWIITTEIIIYLYKSKNKTNNK